MTYAQRVKWPIIVARILLAVSAALFCFAIFNFKLTLPVTSFNYVLVFDITQSMYTEDMTISHTSVSRLDFSKLAARNVLRRLPCGSRISWGIFNGYRTLLLGVPVEVCANYSELVSVLDGVDLKMAWASGSEIAKGVHWAMRLLSKSRDSNSLVFFTDGHEAPPVDPANSLVFEDPIRDVRGLIVGVGGAALSPIPRFDSEGKRLGFWLPDQVVQPSTTATEASQRQVGRSDEASRGVARVVPRGSEHLSSLKNDYLKSLASATGLDYFKLDDPYSLFSVLQKTDYGFKVQRPVDIRNMLGLLGLIFLMGALVVQIDWKALNLFRSKQQF